MFPKFIKWFEELPEKEQRVTAVLLTMTVLALILAAAVLVMLFKDLT